MCVLAFNKKSLLEASGMVFRFHSLQVTFFGISQSDCIKKYFCKWRKNNSIWSL